MVSLPLRIGKGNPEVTNLDQALFFSCCMESGVETRPYPFGGQFAVTSAANPFVFKVATNFLIPTKPNNQETIVTAKNTRMFRVDSGSSGHQGISLVSQTHIVGNAKNIAICTNCMMISRKLITPPYYYFWQLSLLILIP